MQIDKIKWLYIARFFSLTGSQILFFALPLLIFKLTNSIFYSGLAFSIEWAARLISFPLSGYCADHFGSKRVYVLTDLVVGGLCILSLLLMLIFQGISLYVLMILATSAGFLSEQGYVSAESLAPKLVSSQYYPKSQSILEILELMSLLFGPFLSAIFLIYFSLNHLILIAMIFYFLSALAMKIIKVEGHTANTQGNVVHELLLGFNVVKEHSYLIQMILLSMLLNLLFGLMTGSAPAMVVGIFQKSDHFYALLNFSSGLFGAFVIILFNYALKHISILKIGIITFLLACFSCICFGFIHSYLAYVLIYAFFYGVNALFSIFFRSERARIIPKELLGRTIGSIIFITFLFFPLSGLLISISEQTIGLQNLVMLFGILCFIFGIPTLLKIRQIDFVKADEAAS